MERMQRPREQLNITTFYYSGSNQNQKLISVEFETSDSDEEERDSEEEKMAADMLRGFVGTQPGDHSLWDHAWLLWTVFGIWKIRGWTQGRKYEQNRMDYCEEESTNVSSKKRAASYILEGRHSCKLTV